MSGLRRGLMLLAMLVAMMSVWLHTVAAQVATNPVATTTVEDTVYSANGTPASGTVLVNWNAFTTAGGQEVPAGTTSVTIGAGGVLTVALAPNAGSTPMGSYYTAIFHLSDGTTSREYWVIPVTVPGGATTVTLAAIKNEVLPASVAMQTVSKEYVDDAIAAAASGFPLASSPYVLTAGDAMTGALTLAADPVNTLQAADKHYVDVNVAGVTAGLGQKVSLLPTGTQTVAQPGGTSFSIAGVYAGTTFGGTGVANSLNYGANGSPILLSNSANCSGQGYDLGNNGTSAQGWSTCALEDNTLNSSTRGIDQMYAGEFTHDGQGDTSFDYGYLTSFGGKVASSDEGVEYMVGQSHQVGYYSGLVSNGFAGSTHIYGGIPTGYTFLSSIDIIPVSGPLATFTANFFSAPTAQTADIVVATAVPGSTTSFTITNIVPISIAAVSGAQTFTSGTGFTAFNVTAGQYVGIYVPSGSQGPASDSIEQIAFQGAPTLGAMTFSTEGSDGVSISTTMAAATTGATNLVTSSFTCNGYCQAQAGQSFADGGMMLDMSKGGTTATIGAEGTAMGGMYYTLASGTVPVSTAWGNLVSSSCTNNGNGQYQAYTSTTCNVTLGTSPASPGAFVAGQDIFLTGPFEEEAAVTAVGTPVAGVQSITFNTRYAWNLGNPLVMQGGPGGQAFVATSTASSWPVAYAVVGATSATQMYFSNCVVGACNGSGSTGNIIPVPNQGLSGGPLTRTGDVVTATATQNSNFLNFAVGSQIVVSGYTPSDLNGTFTVVSNSYDSFNESVTWAQTGANEASSVSGIVAVADPSITFYPSAFIIGTNEGTQGTAQLATNTVPWAVSDKVVGAPTSEFSNLGLRLAIGQNTPVDGGQGSEGIGVNDDGPAQLTWDYFAGNNIQYGVSSAMFEVQGSYYHVLNLGYRPANNGAVIYVQGGEPVSSNQKPYYLFQDDGSYGSIEFNPSTATFTISRFLNVVSGITATGAASAFAAGTTVGGVLPCLQNGTDCPAGTGSGSGSSGGGTGTVSSVGVGAWPSWLTPAVTNATTTPAIAVMASAIPNAALANSSTTVNGQSCALGGTCTITAAPAAEVKYYEAAVCDGGAAYASGMTRYDNQEPQAGCVLPASSALGYLAFNAAAAAPQYAEATVSTPPYWTGTGMYLNFYSAVVTGSVTWEVQTACVGAGAVVGAPVFGAAVAVTTTVSSTADGDVVTAEVPGVASPGANGCPASPTSPGLMTYRIYRSASDSAAGNANLLGVTLVTGRSQ